MVGPVQRDLVTGLHGLREQARMQPDAGQQNEERRSGADSVELGETRSVPPGSGPSS
jgi:hypothetical protein